MSTMNFQKSFKSRPPDKGSFPLDHEGECKDFKIRFMDCMQRSGQQSSECRLESKAYLECRMERDLMTREPLSKLGFADLVDKNASASKTTESGKAS
ncbi:cytochrome c oxidase assembly protein COX19-like [Anneissia japonica]|uniref:cytochrome c oxidase assembly protein COX19-like n=1 Tax=Anneissia japonica TaxID=1529436 RepID=UPI0014256035|nr:cytochrome c oxidase assembly protein COX19-like [Anneissia japonica]